MKCVLNRRARFENSRRGAIRFFFLLFISVVIAGLGSSCVSAVAPTGDSAKSQIDRPLPSPTPAPVSTPIQVIQGWPDAYSNHIEDRVSTDYPDLLGLSPTRMTTVCPNWDSLDRGGREKFWSALLWAIAGAESNRNRTSIYRETTMSVDSVTGQQIRSEGLLQLSYADVPNYRYTEGDISWDYDRETALADYAAGKTHGNPDRTLLNAYSNLNLGLWIMHRLAAKYPSDKMETAYGRYWSTMRSASSSFSKVISGIRTRSPECFPN